MAVNKAKCILQIRTLINMKPTVINLNVFTGRPVIEQLTNHL